MEHLVRPCLGDIEELKSVHSSVHFVHYYCSLCGYSMDPAWRILNISIAVVA